MFKTGAKINLYIFLIPLVLGITTTSFYFLLLKIKCSSETWKQYVSPNNKWKVVLIKKDCGSLSPLEIKSILIKFNKQHNHSDGNLFAFFLTDSTDQLNDLDNLINISWVNNSRISVIYDEKLDYYLRNYMINGIEIQYKKKVHN